MSLERVSCLRVAWLASEVIVAEFGAGLRTPPLYPTRSRMRCFWRAAGRQPSE